MLVGGDVRRDDDASHGRRDGGPVWSFNRGLGRLRHDQGPQSLDKSGGPAIGGEDGGQERLQ